jgi:hypothetical protein
MNKIYAYPGVKAKKKQVVEQELFTAETGLLLVVTWRRNNWANTLNSHFQFEPLMTAEDCEGCTD